MREQKWLKQAHKGLIRSVSGWRKVFLLKDPTTLEEYDVVFLHHVAKAYISVIKENFVGNKTCTITLGRDSRSTGEAIACVLASALQSENVSVTYLGIISSPQIMAYTEKYADGFICITASHNPPEYNGLKLGDSKGKVISSEGAEKIIQRYDSFIKDKSFELSSINVVENSMEKRKAKEVYAYKVCFAVFRNLIKSEKEQNIVQDYSSIVDIVSKRIKNSRRALGVVWDSNGGARSSSFDSTFLNKMGVVVHTMNTKYGEFSHEIIPEGNSLIPASNMLIELQKKRPNINWIMAVVCDCDGDRGNAVFTSKTGACCLSAQEMFILNLNIELAWQKYTHPFGKTAVVVNGPSTLRCNLLADAYGAKIFRTEVGEANVVRKGNILRKQGYDIPILGEASNGGTIIYPSKVRDPLCTALTLIKSFIWSEELYFPNNLPAILKGLPCGHSTATEHPKAKMFLSSYGDFYSRISLIIKTYNGYEKSFFSLFKKYGIEVRSIQWHNFSKTEVTYINDLSFSVTGGVALYFYSDIHKQCPCAFVWLRPSGTEPVLRVMADVLHPNAEVEGELIDLWRLVLNDVIQL